MEKPTPVFCEKLRTQRGALMGAAILLICFYHIGENLFYDFGVLENFLNRFHDICYGGVDIFFFLSGYGTYCSLRKDADPLRFLSRRASRLLWPYLPFIIVWFLLKTRDAAWSFDTVLALFGNITMTGWLAGRDWQFNWYAQLLFWFYLLTPFFFAWLERTDAPSRVRARDIALPAVLLVFSFSLLQCNALIGVSRLPLYTVGMLFAKYSMQPRRLSPTGYALLIASGLAGLACLHFALRQPSDLCWSYGMWWYPFLLITPGLCLALAALFDRLSGCRATRWIPRGLSFLGAASFEIYLIHVAAYNLAPGFLAMNGRGAWVVLLVLSCCAGVAYHAAIEALRKRHSRRRTVGGGN